MKMKKLTKTIVIIIGLILLIAIVLLFPLLYSGTNEIKIVEQRFLTFDEILSQDYLQNTTAIVDIWGTYCSPCLKEFDYLAEIKEKYRDKNLKFLYLCPMKRIDHKVRWKKIIKEKQLVGIHIAVDTEELFNDIWEQYLNEPLSAKYMVPLYFLVKYGIIVVPYAAPPSSKKKLCNQIDSVLNLK